VVGAGCWCGARCGPHRASRRLVRRRGVRTSSARLPSRANTQRAATTSCVWNGGVQAPERSLAPACTASLGSLSAASGGEVHLVKRAWTLPVTHTVRCPKASAERPAKAASRQAVQPAGSSLTEPEASSIQTLRAGAEARRGAARGAGTAGLRSRVHARVYGPAHSTQIAERRQPERAFDGYLRGGRRRDRRWRLLRSAALGNSGSTAPWVSTASTMPTMAGSSTPRAVRSSTSRCE